MHKRKRGEGHTRKGPREQRVWGAVSYIRRDACSSGRCLLDQRKPVCSDARRGGGGGGGGAVSKREPLGASRRPTGVSRGARPGRQQQQRCSESLVTAGALEEEAHLRKLRRFASDSSPFTAGRSRQRQRRPRRPRASRASLKVADYRAREAAPVPKEEPAAAAPPEERPSSRDDGSRQLLEPGLLGAALGRQHSLRYQRQTLESPASLEDLLDTEASSPGPGEELELEPETFYSSTQSLLSASYKSYGSPKREAETQTQGEHKSTQYELEDLAELVDDVYDKRSDSRERLESLIEARFGSPRREAEVQTELESKAVQCVSEELDLASGVLVGSPRKEAQVQTDQDSKSTQCDFTEFGQLPVELAQWQQQQLAEAKSPQAQRLAECSASPLESTSPASLSPQRGPSPLILLVKGGGGAARYVDMTVTHRDKDGNVVWAKHWGPERLVEIYREPQTSLGLSIVGGKVDLQDSSSSSKSSNVSGIFIKNVIPNSPAGRAGGLQIGDRIIEVDGVDLRNSTHERAVKAIQAAGNPVRLTVQSLVTLSPENEGSAQEAAAGGPRRSGSKRHSTRNRSSTPTSSFRNKSPEVIQDGKQDLKKQTGGMADGAGPSDKKKAEAQGNFSRDASRDGEQQQKPKQPAAPKPENKYSSGESSEEEEEDTRDMEGNVYTKKGVEISRRSAGNVKRTKEEIAADPEEEDEFGYTANKVKKKYAGLKKPVIMTTLERTRHGIGISLAGHKDRHKMAVFISGIDPNGVAAKDGKLAVGDEILEVNGTVFQGRCHLNVTTMIKTMPYTTYKIIVIRRPKAMECCAVPPTTVFPTPLPAEDYSHYKGVHPVPIKKGTYGLGIMIIEGKHGEVGQGIFVSDVQEGGAAELVYE